MKKLLCSALLLTFSFMGLAQEVYIENNTFKVNDCSIYFNGANTPWQNWNDFGGNYNSNFWSSEFARLKNSGINATRIWISCDGAGQPSINSSGAVTGVSQAFWDDCDDMFAAAQANGIYIMATLMSFDHTKNGNTNAANWQNMMNSQANVQTYVDNYLAPFVNRYKSNPYLWCIDVCNEIEWIYENGGSRGDGTNWGGSSYPILQRFVAMCAAGVHNNPRNDGTSVLVTLGSASVKWNGSKLPGGGNNSDGNKWSDTNLKAQYNQSNAILDFYSPHFYGWMEQYYSSPFEKTPVQFGMNEKPCVVAEMPSKDPLPTPGMSLTTAFNNLKTGGWQGQMPWTSNLTSGTNDEIGTLTDFGSAAQAFTNANPNLVHPACAAVSCQAPSLGTAKSLCGTSDGITLDASIKTKTNKTFKWYKDGNLISGAIASTYKVTQPGLYKVEVDSASGACVKSSEVTVSAALPKPALGNDLILCTNPEETLDAKVTGNYSFSWLKNGVSMQGETSNTLVVSSAGTYVVVVSASGCAAVSDTLSVSSGMLPTENDTICTAGQVTLKVSSGSGTYEWYDAASGGNSLGTGNQYTTTVNSTKTFYVQDAGGASSNIGLAQINPNGTIWELGTADFNTDDKKDLITVTKPLTLASLAVYPVTANGTVTIRILDGTTVVASKSFTGVGTGKQILQLDFSLQPGIYTIDAAGTNGTNLQYLASDAVFPYQTAGGEIRFKINASYGADRYGMFFDWKIVEGNACVRSAATAVIDPLNPICATITAIPAISVSGAVVSPNPFSDYVILNTGTEAGGSIRVSDMKGKEMFRGKVEGKTLQLGENWLPGVYMLEISKGREREIIKLIKAN